MPQPDRKRVLKIPLQPFDSEKEVSQKHGTLPLTDNSVDITKSFVPSFRDPSSLRKTPSLPQKVLGGKLGQTRIVGGLPPKSTMNVFSGKLPLKSRNVTPGKLPTRAASLLNKKASSSRIVTKTLMQREREAPRFLSILRAKGRLVRHKTATPPLGRKVWWNAEESSRLSYVKRLQLFQALLKEPLPFLELHCRFRVSKQTIRGLVKNGFLMETWGPKAVGVRFKPTSKGKIHLKELEAAAKIEPKIRKKASIRLKHGIPL